MPKTVVIYPAVKVTTTMRSDLKQRCINSKIKFAEALEFGALRMLGIENNVDEVTTIVEKSDKFKRVVRAKEIMQTQLLKISDELDSLKGGRGDE